MANLTTAISSFGPVAQGRFDFTLFFEDAILSIVPSAIFLLLAVVEFSRLSRQPVKALSGSLRYAKLVCRTAPLFALRPG